MAANQLSLEERKFVLKCYWKTENATEVQRRFTSEFAKPPPTRRTIDALKLEIERQCRDIPNDMFRDVCKSLGARYQRCLDNNGHFEQDFSLQDIRLAPDAVRIVRVLKFHFYKLDNTIFFTACCCRKLQSGGNHAKAQRGNHCERPRHDHTIGVQSS